MEEQNQGSRGAAPHFGPNENQAHQETTRIGQEDY